MKRSQNEQKGANFGCYRFLLIYYVEKSTTRGEFWRKMTIYLIFYVLLHQN